MEYIVKTTDTSMSGWGVCEGKSNILLLLCDNIMEANRVKKNLNSKKEMKHTFIYNRYTQKLCGMSVTNLLFVGVKNYALKSKYIQVKSKKEMPLFYR